MLLGSIVLAGGRSRRMGRPKESLPFGESTLLGHAVDTLLACTHPVVVVARDTTQDLPPLAIEAEVVFDDVVDQGPLVGLLAGLRHCADECDAVFVTGCDAPFLTARAIDRIASHLGQHDIVMPQIGEHLQPLAAIYHTRVLPAVERLVHAGTRSPRALVDQCDTRVLSEADLRTFDPDFALFRNLNDPGDYDAARDR